jgi:hypothetical protein
MAQVIGEGNHRVAESLLRSRQNGSSLSNKMIDRFSKDLGLTCNIHKLIPDWIGGGGELPANQRRLCEIRSRTGPAQRAGSDSSGLDGLEQV